MKTTREGGKSTGDVWDFTKNPFKKLKGLGIACLYSKSPRYSLNRIGV
jgi:hypothetical protein